MATRRQLAAIMYTDIAGFSYMLNHNPDMASRIRKRHLQILKDAHDRYHGNIALHMGDTTLSIFDSAAEAVECAYMLQVELGKEPEIPLRIGIHTGEILYDEGGAYGEGISVAAKIQRLAAPRSILISGKVYDDIKNHTWLTANSLGQSLLDDLLQSMELYVISNRGLTVPSRPSLQSQPPSFAPAQQSDESEEDGQFLGKSKLVAAFLALFFGLTGVHRFYLGQRFKGMLYFALSTFAMIVTIEEGVPLIAFMGILTFIDAILFFAMPEVEFDSKYNYSQTKPLKGRKRKITRRKTKSADSVFRLLKNAMSKYESRNYKTAIQLFDEVLAKEPDNTVAHFCLACCFSRIKDADTSVFHLDKAISYGFDDFERIKKDRALSYLRSQPQFRKIQKHYFDPAPTLPPPAESSKDDETLDLTPIERLELLGNKFEEGQLSQREFDVEKRRILGSE